MDLDRPDRAARLDGLAAEFALGTLPGRVRRRLARAARADPIVAAAIAEWEFRLGVLAEAVPGITPPPLVWEGIRSRLGLAPPAGAAPAGPAPRWASLRIWQGLALASFAVAFALAVTVFAPRGEAPQDVIVVVLAGPDAKPVLVASAERGTRWLTVKPLAPVNLEAGRALELWALPEGAAPRSLGLIPAAGIARVALPAPAGTALRDVSALAVSLEPAGGSPSGKPTGPVLYTGGVERLY
jgi:anti-sigma-K factor RskA